MQAVRHWRSTKLDALGATHAHTLRFVGSSDVERHGYAKRRRVVHVYEFHDLQFQRHAIPLHVRSWLAVLDGQVVDLISFGSEAAIESLFRCEFLCSVCPECHADGPFWLKLDVVEVF